MYFEIALIPKDICILTLTNKFYSYFLKDSPVNFKNIYLTEN